MPVRAILLIGLLGGGAGWAPELTGQTGAVYGTVRDSASLAPVPGAHVAAGPAHTALSDVAGHYTLTGIPVGHVIVSVRRLGYLAAADTVTLAPGDSLRLDIVLRPRSLSLAPVVVTAGKRSQFLDQIATSVAIVTDTVIARRAVNTVDEAVDKAPGVQMINGQVNIRGSSGFVQGFGSRVLLLVDGVPANEGDRGGINWDMLPMEDVERVEIVKGAGSSLYGSSALGGVINLITRDVPAGAHARVRAMAGAFANPPRAIWRFRDNTGTQQGLDVTGSYGGDALRGSLTAGGRHSDGYREQDRSDTWEALGQAAWLPSNATRLRVTGSWVSHQYQVPVRWCEAGTCDDRGLAYQPFKIDMTNGGAGAYTRSDKGFLSATLDHTVSPRVAWLARGSWLRTDFTDHRPPGGEYGVADRYGFEVRGEVHPSQRRVVVVGAEGARADVASDIFKNHTETALAAYAEGEQRLGSARLTAGARLDYVETDGGSVNAVISPRVGAVVPQGAVVWRASAGRGFRAPSLAERFVGESAGPVRVIPNPDLHPETAWSFELGNTARIASALRTDVALFWTEARSLIEPSVDSALQIQFRNLQRARVAGLDLSASAAPVRHLEASVAYTFLYTRDLDSTPSPPLAFRPKHLLTLTADYVWKALSVGADFRVMSRYERVELYQPTDPVLSPKILDLRATFRAGPLSARLLATNALNYLYNLSPQALAPVRTVTVAFTWTY